MNTRTISSYADVISRIASIDELRSREFHRGQEYHAADGSTRSEPDAGLFPGADGIIRLRTPQPVKANRAGSLTLPHVVSRASSLTRNPGKINSSDRCTSKQRLPGLLARMVESTRQLRLLAAVARAFPVFFSKLSFSWPPPSCSTHHRVGASQIHHAALRQQRSGRDAFNAAFVLPDLISYFLVGGAASITFVTHPHALPRNRPRSRR